MLFRSIEDVREETLDYNYEERRTTQQIHGLAQGPIHGFSVVLEKNKEIRERTTHRKLKADLVQHIWQRFN